MLRFYKYQGTGNDLILLNGFEDELEDLRADRIALLCDRHFGIGGDGLILIGPDPEVDMEMRFFNPDGSRSFCGNGSRCAVRAFFDLGVGGPDEAPIRFRAIDGIHEGKLLDDGDIEVSIGDVNGVERKEDHYFVDTGSPHVLSLFRDIEGVELEEQAVELRRGYEGSGGTNVNLIQLLSKGSLSMRTFERGVDAETLSCGSGVTAAAILASFLGHASNECNVRTRGGDLTVRFERADDVFRRIRLIGPAERVFKGRME